MTKWNRKEKQKSYDDKSGADMEKGKRTGQKLVESATEPTSSFMSQYANTAVPGFIVDSQYLALTT